MKIQILGIRDRHIKIDGYDIVYSRFDEPKTLDSFDVNITFIGETKGIDTNIKSKNILLVDTHLQNYRDSLSEDGLMEKLKALLVNNPLRNKSLEDREPVHGQQIDLAKRYNCLIVLIQDLLKIYEMYKSGGLKKI